MHGGIERQIAAKFNTGTKSRQHHPIKKNFGHFGPKPHLFNNMLRDLDVRGHFAIAAEADPS